MAQNPVDLSYYIYNDLRAKQNENFEKGNIVQNFDTLSEAVAEFNRLPKEWTTALGVHLGERSDLDLVQRREGEPVLSGDYARIADYYGNPDIQDTLRQLCSELSIEWQNDFRVFGGWNNVLIPIPPNLDFMWDRALNGKHLVPEDLRHTFTAIREAYVEGEGWMSLDNVWDLVQANGYDNPHTPKVRTIHACYADERGEMHHGDLHPYSYILLQERTKIMERDKDAMKNLATAVEEYIYRKNPDGYKALFGPVDRNAVVEHSPRGSIFDKTAKTKNVERVCDLINKRDLAPMVDPITTILEGGLTRGSDRIEAREILNRVLNIPEDGEKKMPLDLRMRAKTALNEIYTKGAEPTKRQVQALEKTPDITEGR